MYNIEREFNMQERRRVTFPLMPDNSFLEADTRFLMSNSQLITKSPKPSEEESLMRFSGLVEHKDRPITKPLNIRENYNYNSVKRPMGAPITPVNTYEKFYKKTAVEESKERAKRAAVPPRPAKGYVSPLERDEKKTLAKPKPVVETSIPEYRKRALRNKDVIETKAQRESPKQRSLFNREKGDDYFTKKRSSLFDRNT